MSERKPLTPELQAVEAALASLSPTPVDPAERDRLMFAAGRAVGKRPHFMRDGLVPACVTLMIFCGWLWIVDMRSPRWRSTAMPNAPTIVSPSGPQVGVAPTVVLPAFPGGASDVDFAAVDLSAPTSYFQLRRHLDEIELVFDGPGLRSVDDLPPTAKSRRDLLHELLN
jgi:hypothetical protein